MKLKRLLKDIAVKQFKGSKETEITGICSDSKRVAPGNLFVARKGKVNDGAAYIPEAIAAGANAILTDIYDPFLRDIAQLVDPDIKKVEASIADHFYQQASRSLFMVGITGTNGKTTTSYLVRHLLDQQPGPCGLIGTIEYIIGQSRYQAFRTTPDVVSNHKMLREMVLQGCSSAVMEVTSHALDQGRVANIDFDVAVFTNLTLDHLDYHGTMEAYAAAKKRLFTSLNPKKKAHQVPKTAIVNADCPWHARMIEGCSAAILTYGITYPADLHASEIRLTEAGSTFLLNYRGEKKEVVIPLVGKHNISNALAAIGVALTRGIGLETILSKLATAPAVPGRLHRVPNSLGLNIYVDFAHSDDALQNVFECLQGLRKGRLFTVFGCGGDRDRSKRSKMGAVSGKFSDLTIVTSDNPRSEPPEAIAAEIVRGFAAEDRYEVILDRREAIKRALELAHPDDVVLIAGKGHENTQIFAHQTIDFDDCKVAAVACQELAHAASL